MSLVVAAVNDKPLKDCGTRQLVVFILGLTVGGAVYFLGGDAAVKGNIPLGAAKEHPLVVSATGGIAAILITFLLGHQLYAANCNEQIVDPDPTSPFSIYIACKTESAISVQTYNFPYQDIKTKSSQPDAFSKLVNSLPNRSCETAGASIFRVKDELRLSPGGDLTATEGNNTAVIVIPQPVLKEFDNDPHLAFSVVHSQIRKGLSEGQSKENPPIQTDVPDAFRDATGQINYPSPGATLNTSFNAYGTAQNVGKSVHLWLLVEINGRYWPKESRVVVDTNSVWHTQVFEDGTPERFELSLWAANQQANQQLIAWLEAGSETGNFPEFKLLPGMKRLSRVDGLRTAPLVDGLRTAPLPEDGNPKSQLTSIFQVREN